MKRISLFVLLMLAAILMSVTVPVRAQFVTIARKIKSMHTPKADVATVILDARTFMVYRTITDTLTTNKTFQITGRDNARRFVEFTHQDYKVSMQVDSLESKLAQITVTSVHSDNPGKQATDVAVEAIQRVCRMAGIKCTVSGQ